jgi:hypothetical protein
MVSQLPMQSVPITTNVVSSNPAYVMKCTPIGEKTCNCSCFEIDQEMDAILLIIDIVYGVCRIVIKSVQQCRHFLYFVNLLSVGLNYGQRTMQVCS